MNNIYVKRAPRWSWGSQDGSIDSNDLRIGIIKNICRSCEWVKVIWFHGSTNYYRLGLDVIEASEAEVKKALESASKALRKGEQLTDKHLICTFGYACGLSHPFFASFDIRDEVCIAIGGFKHGQIVLHNNSKSVVIGVKPDDYGVLKLWFHNNNYPGAGIFLNDRLQERHYDTDSNQIVLEGNPTHFRYQENWDVNNQLKLKPLNPTFKYLIGINNSDIPITKEFDISDEMCKAYGGFVHGDVVCILRDADDETVTPQNPEGSRMRKFAVVGVANSSNGIVLWVHQNNHYGATYIKYEKWRTLYKIGTCRLINHI